MSNSKTLAKDVPSKDYEFYVEVEGKVSRTTYRGDFKFSIPNLKLKALADKKRAELNGGLDMALDTSVLELHYMIAFLRFTLSEMPPWWKEADYGYDLEDFNVIKAVYDKVEEFQKGWMAQVWGKEEEDKDGEKETGDK